MAIKGEKEVLSNFKLQRKSYPRSHIAALLAEGYDIMAKSIPLVPVEFSVLRNARYVAIQGGATAALRLGTAIVEIGFGTDYAVPVHEKDEVSHTVGQSQYLRQPFDAATPGLMRRMKKRTVLFHKLGVGAQALPRLQPSKPKIKQVSEARRRRARKKKRKALKARK